MSSVTTPSVVRQIGSLFDGGSVVGFTDRQLIERYNDRRDATGEAAFAALVTRHGPTIMHVCRQLLDDHHAEDAFQAVFLVLACKARSIRDPDKLGNWLYGVALRTAKKAQGRLARRYKNEVGSAMRHPGSGPGVRVEPMVQSAEQRVLAREQAEVLHREIDRLPGPFRLAIVLCYFEGLTLDEAAHRLRCPAGTVRSRLARACDKLRRGLTRRGVVLSAAGLVAALSSRSASASVSSLLCHNTTRAAMNFAAGQAATGTVSASAATLAQEVLRSMLIHKLRFTLVTLLTIAACATGAGLSTTHSLAIEDEPKKTTAAPQTRPAAEPKGSKPGRMIVVGRVLDPQGKPVPNATIMVYAALKQPGRGGWIAWMSPSAIGQARCEDSGRFQLDAPRTSSSIHFQVGAVAVAPGFGASWVDLDLDAAQPAVEITLRPEQVIHGRLFDVQGRPVQGVSVSVEGMGHFRRKPDSIPEDIDGPYFWGGNHAKNVSGWPQPTITDAEGRFAVRGVGRDLRVLLMAEDPRFARQSIVIDTDSVSESKQVTLAMEPAKIITGRVTYADTGKPVPHASLEIIAYRRNAGYSNPFETDAEGRFRANPLSTDRYRVSAYAPEGQPYHLSGWTKIFAWTKGALEHRVDLALPRGTVIRGKVTEEASGKPVAGAMLGYISRSSQDEESGARNGRTESETDGSFQFAVLPKPGYLIVVGPSEDYVFQEIGRRMINLGQPGGIRCYAHAFIARDLKPGGDTQEVNITLRRGMTVKGHVVGPDGQPVQDAWMFSQIIPFPQPIPWRYWWGGYHGNARNGHFELHGLAPDVEVPVFFLEPKRKLGATVNLSGRSDPGGPITIRLESCGTAKARLVDSSGKPLAEYRDPYLLSMVVTPGPSRFSRDKADQSRLAADQDDLSRIDSINYVDGPVSDSQGRVIFPALIPGATYRVYDRTTIDNEAGPQLRKEFTVKPGETLDLGDILMEKPQP